MKTVPLIRVTALLPFTSFLGEIGAPVEQLWDEAGLPPLALSCSASFVPLRSAAAFLEAAAARERIFDLGIVVAQRTVPQPAGRTLEHALARRRERLALHCSGARAWATLDADEVRFCQRWRMQDEPFAQLDLFSVARLIGLVRVAAGADWRPRAIELQSSPGDVAALERFAGAHVRTSRAATTVSAPRHLLHLPMRGPASPIAPVAHLSAPRPLAAPPGDLAGSLLVVIANFIGSGQPTLAATARAAGVSARTLQRRLTEASTCFTELIDRARFERASALLEETPAKVITVALELGYSDAAHFTRAFRRWSGASPLEHRTRYRGRHERDARSA